ncbi:MAG: Bro-N domain-containing protein, partial [Duncaniella sp.]|nr:Bro-N domain-containing protein [Duncaniella sp.]
EFGELGVMLIDGKEYFPANQCAAILGYAVPKDAIARHCKGALKRRLPTNGGVQEVKLIPEGDLYRLIVSSKLPKAEEFERWVFDTVLPQIRHNGGYIGNAEELIAKTATAVVSEVMKQIAPLLKRQNVYYDPLEELRLKAIVSPQPRHKVMCTIKRLDTELRKQVDEMILSDRFSYDDIRAYLARFGIAISNSAICRYRKSIYE